MEFSLQMHGLGEFRDITDRIESFVAYSKIEEGIVTVFAKHTTVSIIIADNEEGLKKDFLDVLEEIAPEDRNYRHNSPGDMNAHAHIRSMLAGCSVTVPIVDGELDLGTWQRIFVVDFDNRQRERSISIQILRKEP